MPSPKSEFVFFFRISIYIACQDDCLLWKAKTPAICRIRQEPNWGEKWKRNGLKVQPSEKGSVLWSEDWETLEKRRYFSLKHHKAYSALASTDRFSYSVYIFRTNSAFSTQKKFAKLLYAHLLFLSQSYKTWDEDIRDAVIYIDWIYCNLSWIA